MEPVGSDFLSQAKWDLWTPRCQSQKFRFAFAVSFLCPFSWPLGGHVRGGSLVKPVRGGADWHGARSTGIDRLDVASGGRQHSLSFILWSILTTLTHTHLHQCSVSLVFISQRTPSGLMNFEILPSPHRPFQPPSTAVHGGGGPRGPPHGPSPDHKAPGPPRGTAALILKHRTRIGAASPAENDFFSL